MPLVYPKTLVVFLGLATGSASCTGTIGDTTLDPGSSGPGVGGAGGHVVSAGGNGGGTCAPPVVEAAAVLPTALRVRQYANTLSDLLQFDVSPFIHFSNGGGRDVSPGVFFARGDVEDRLKTAEAIAAEVASPMRLASLLRGRVGCDPAVSGNAACRDKLVDSIGRRAFRRVLEVEERADMVALFDGGLATTGQFASGVEAFVAGVLQSPEFLYQLPITTAGSAPIGKQVVRLDDYALASRLSYFLWNSMPDDALLAAADGQRLRDPKDVEAQVRRMIKSSRAQETRHDLFATWLMLNDLPGVPHGDPEFTPSVGADLAGSVLALVDDVYAKNPTMDALLGGNTLFLNAALGALYFPTRTLTLGSDFRPVAVDSKERRGLVTHPALMAMLAHATNEGRNPIKRGVFIKKTWLCEVPPAKPNDMKIPELPNVQPGVSSRQALAMHRAAPQCAGCHAYFDPIGFAFESYDGIGRYRTTDRGLRIDSSSDVIGTQDVNGTFATGADFFDRINKSSAVRGCFARQWYQYALARALDTGGVDACTLGGVKARFSANGDLNDLLVSIATSGAFLNQQIGE